MGSFNHSFNSILGKEEKSSTVVGQKWTKHIIVPLNNSGVSLKIWPPCGHERWPFRPEPQIRQSNKTNPTGPRMDKTHHCGTRQHEAGLKCIFLAILAEEGKENFVTRFLNSKTFEF